ncbi:MAG: SWIM zinc finger family protein [Myxococcales bacterium]|nr:MAG: SWIM zinc finger family protein [Myxococcales bacterium]
MTAAEEKIRFDYGATSEVKVAEGTSQIRLSLDQGRGTVGVRGRPTDPALLRDTLATTLQILASDLRYRGRDRTAYLAYLMKQGKKANAAIWEAQKAYLDAQFADDKQVSGVLDPVLTVDPDEVSLEVFSRDESAYARLALSSQLFEGREAAHGTTFVDAPASFLESLDRLPGYLPVQLDASTSLGQPHAAARDVSVPHAWLRGFLQVQSAATLPAATCHLAPIDLYNLLFALRTRKPKNPPRGLRFELIPGQPARLIIEPWELVLETHGAPYEGKTARVIRTYGRQRLVTLARALPYLKSARVQLLGPGLPIFWVLDFGLATLTMALTGWSESSWASAAAFDRLMPPAERGAPLGERVVTLLRERGPQPLEAVQAALGAPREEARSALQRECLRGRVLFDVARGVYRPRQLLTSPLPDEALRYGSPREARAHRLLDDKGSVQLTKIHEISGEGVEIHGEVTDREARRQFTPRFTMDQESRVNEAWCNCATYQRSGLREGPCEHMIALRLVYARRLVEAEALRQTPEGRRAIRAETRVFTRRDPSGRETVYRVSLDDKVVQVQWGQRAATPRHQRLWYDSDAQAREAYFSRLESLATEGFVDADAAG